MVEAYDKGVQVRIWVLSWFTFCGKIQHATLIILLIRIYYNCCISCSAMEPFVIFVVLVVLLWHLLLYLPY